MSYKKIVFTLTFLAVLGGVFVINPTPAKAQTPAPTVSAEELEAQIATLLEQLRALQEKLVEMKGEEAWCHDFHLNLKYGMAGTEVRALQTALQKEGFYKRTITGRFDEYTASAVVGFQEKYASEILTPWGLSHGTGYVGRTTRAKLNEIYGCKVKPYIKVLSPNGGEEWIGTKSYKISWTQSNLRSKTVDILLAGYDQYGNQIDDWKLIKAGISASQGYFYWAPYGAPYLISKFSTTPDKYKIRVREVSGPIYIGTYDDSNNYFSIVEKETCHTTSLWSWDYCSSTCKCDAGEGDCDTDADCNTGYCAKNVGAKYGQVSSMDVCEEKPIPKPDLTVADIYYDGAYYIKVKYCNEGSSSSADDFLIKLRNEDTGKEYPGNAYYRFSVPSPGECVITGGYTCGLIGVSSGERVTVSATIDWEQRVSESNEDNNTLTKTIGEGVKSITVLSPNGGEEWLVGNSYEIKWQSQGFSKAVILVTDYTYSSEISTWVVESTDASKGSYSWTIPEDFLASHPRWKSGDDFKVFIGELKSDGTYGAQDDSDNYFSIVEKETCHTTSLWSWDYCSSTCKCDAGEGDCDTDADCNTGYCAKNVGAKYGQVSSMDVCEEKPSITVLSPNGGEEWTEGETYDITWTSSGIDKINLYLQTFAPPGGLTSLISTIATNISGSLGKYSWKVPFGITGTNRQINITGDGLFDGSDSSFIIVSGSTCDQKCKDLGYKSGICRSWAVVPTAEVGCKNGEKDIGQTSDCYIPEGLVGSGKTCCCQVEPPVEVTCTDSDEGKDYYLKGTTKWGPIGEKYYTATDGCDTAGKVLSERYCYYSENLKGYYSGVEYYTCPYGCQDGACLKSASYQSISNSLASITRAVSKLIESVKNYIAGR